VDVDEFCERYPRLWHLADADAWPGIQRHGLLTTSQLLDRFEVVDLARRRPHDEAPR
jgi:hypothetical protein